MTCVVRGKGREGGRGKSAREVLAKCSVRSGCEQGWKTRVQKERRRSVKRTLERDDLDVRHFERFRSG